MILGKVLTELLLARNTKDKCGSVMEILAGLCILYIIMRIGITDPVLFSEHVIDYSGSIAILYGGRKVLNATAHSIEKRKKGKS